MLVYIPVSKLQQFCTALRLSTLLGGFIFVPFISMGWWRRAREQVDGVCVCVCRTRELRATPSFSGALYKRLVLAGHSQLMA